MRFLSAMALSLALGAAGCCWDAGADRVSGIHAASSLDQSALQWGPAEQAVAPDVRFFVYYYGDAPKELVELYDSAEARVDVGITPEENPDGCANLEVYAPREPLAPGAYLLVHRASGSPGGLEDSGYPEGDYADLIEVFQGEPALIVRLRIEPAGDGA